MAKSDRNNVQIINELWQKIFNLTQDEKITAISSNIKAYSGDKKWIIHVPGLCKISLKLDAGVVGEPEEGEAGESAIQGMEGETGFKTGLENTNDDSDNYDASDMGYDDFKHEGGRFGESAMKNYVEDFKYGDK